MHIRHFHDHERGQVAELQIASWRAAYVDLVPAHALGPNLDRDVTKRWQEITLGAGEFVLVAEEDRQLNGFVTVLAQDIPFIDNFHVRPGLYRSGIGRALMRATGNELIKQGQSAVALTVLEQNTRALAFYKGLGGTSVKRFSHVFLDKEAFVHRMEWHDLAALSHA